MFALLIRDTSRLHFPPSLTASSLVRRIPSSTSTATPLSLPRSASIYLPRKYSGYSIKSSKTSPRAFSSFRSRPFSSSATRVFQHGDNQYRRFNNPNHGPLLMRLWRNAKPHHIIIIGVSIGGFYMYNLETVEMTGRQRFNCVPAGFEVRMGDKNYQEVLHEARGSILPANHPIALQVDAVLQRLIPYAPIEGAAWKVHVINDDSTRNAFVLPGGKVFVYTGILPICQDEDGLAAVLGHEIAHVVAHHPAERMCNSFITMGVAFLVSFLLDISGQIPSLILGFAYHLPNSRIQEAEADQIGLMIMSKACFKPEAAVGLWARMHEAEENAPPQFMSTHPSSYNRMESIREWCIKAEATYEDSGCHAIGGFVPAFQQTAYEDYW